MLAWVAPMAEEGAVDYDARYASGWAYGKAPNEFLAAAAADHLPQGQVLRVLSLGEGQGRNTAHLAALGHRCVAVDASGVGLGKARLLAEQRGVTDRVTTLQADLERKTPKTAQSTKTHSREVPLSGAWL